MGERGISGRTMRTPELIRKIFTNRYLVLLLRLYIGGIFVYASMHKISYPGEFAENIAGYQIVPFWAVNLMAVVMPWVELLCGLLLIVGIRVKSNIALIAGMLVLFIVAISIGLMRGAPIGCGCFHSVEDAMSWTTLLRDLIWLAMAVHVYLFDSAFQLERKFFPSIKDIEP